jgi:hypothetical protein
VKGAGGSVGPGKGREGGHIHAAASAGRARYPTARRRFGWRIGGSGSREPPHRSIGEHMGYRLIYTIRCRACGHRRYMNEDTERDLASAAGRDSFDRATYGAVSHRLLCSQCGTRGKTQLMSKPVPGRRSRKQQNPRPAGGAPPPPPREPRKNVRSASADPERCAKCGRRKEALHMHRQHCGNCLAEAENERNRLGRPRLDFCPRCGRRQCRC